ncbi:MAG TPA: fatty acid desaturase [Pirellulales bacterium]|jgi:fatty acid desaturase
MIERTSVPATFSLAQARHIVKDLFTPVPAIYWADFLLSTFVGMAAFGLVRRVLPPLSLAQAIGFVICGLSFYRAVLFTHELVHFRDKTFTAFRVVWNLLCGIPFLMPSFMYYTHVDHHMRKHFGTKHDGEYLPLGSTPPSQILLYLCQPFLIPIIAVVRFLVLSPISWVSPVFRDFVHRRASSLVMDPTYIRPLPSRQVLRIFRLQEALCFLWTASIAVLLTLGIVPIGFLIMAYSVSVFILFMNAARTLGAHRYTSHGEEATFVEQLLDSINYPRWPFLSALWAPVGLRFHALHHLFPSLPYHNLTKAHARLMAELPADSPYRKTESTGLFASLVQLWRTSRAAHPHRPRTQAASLYRMSPAAQSLTRAH